MITLQRHGYGFPNVETGAQVYGVLNRPFSTIYPVKAINPQVPSGRSVKERYTIRPTGSFQDVSRKLRVVPDRDFSYEGVSQTDQQMSFDAAEAGGLSIPRGVRLPKGFVASILPKLIVKMLKKQDVPINQPNAVISGLRTIISNRPTVSEIASGLGSTVSGVVSTITSAISSISDYVSSEAADERPELNLDVGKLGSMEAEETAYSNLPVPNPPPRFRASMTKQAASSLEIQSSLSEQSILKDLHSPTAVPVEGPADLPDVFEIEPPVKPAKKRGKQIPEGEPGSSTNPIIIDEPKLVSYDGRSGEIRVKPKGKPTVRISAKKLSKMDHNSDEARTLVGYLLQISNTDFKDPTSRVSLQKSLQNERAANIDNTSKRIIGEIFKESRINPIYKV